MKLQSFRIKNFKSIIDSGWCDLSADNITGLIGQNEAGKSAILEALYCLHTGKIDKDALRNDDSHPEVSCSFVFTENEFKECYKSHNLPNGLTEKLKEKGWRINATVKWNNDGNCTVELEEKDVRELFYPQNKNNEEIKIISEKDFLDELDKKRPTFQFFEDNTSLLPDRIDFDDIIKKNKNANGYAAAMNFISIAKIDLDYIKNKQSGTLRTYLTERNKTIKVNFQEFWRQKIGKSNKITIEFNYGNYSDSHEKKGKYYLEFWVNDGHNNLHPKQRSKGVRWFVSFWLYLKAHKMKNENGAILLIDEPGQSLHARAQEDVLKVFEDIRSKIQIIYTTHSQYLVELENIHRYLAVQRSSENDEKSETLVIDAQHLGSASSDTLSPLLENMGIDFSHQNVIQKKNNIVLEEPSAYYYFLAFKKLTGETFVSNFLPATGVNKIQQLVYLLLGWRIEFIVVCDDDKNGREVYKNLMKNLYQDREDIAKNKILKIKGCDGIEDIFTKTDFKKYLIEDESAEIPASNSTFIKSKNISKPITAFKFYEKVKNELIKIEMLDNQTKEKITSTITSIKNMIE